MKKLFVIFFMIGFLAHVENKSYGQLRYQLGFLDPYVIKIKVNALLLKGKENCMYKRKMCNLYDINVVEVYYLSRSKYFDSTSLMKFKYLLTLESFQDSLFI